MEQENTAPEETGRTVAHLRMAMAESRIKNYQLSRMTGVREPKLSMILSEKKAPPPGFIEKGFTAVRVLVEAEEAKEKRILEGMKELETSAV